MSPAAEVGTPAASADVLTLERPGSDFMVDVIKSLGFEYIFANPGSSFRGLHESFITYGGNRAPEFLTRALDSAAEQRLTSRSHYIRAVLLDRLRADGIDPAPAFLEKKD